jgi:Phage derived protein Gp49-like (DUF891)
VNAEVQAELDALPVDVRANFERIVRLVRAIGLERVREPYIKHIEGPIWEMRLRGRDRIARALYVTATSRRVVNPEGVHEEDSKDATSRNRARTTTCGGSHMSKKMIPVEESFGAWRKDP